MTGEVIKSFLVGLGFGVDDASLAKFNKAIASATVKVTALSASVSAAATGIFYSITKISDGFEEMGYSLRLVAPAINKMLILRQAMISAYRAAGIDITKVVQQSILFNYSLAKTKFALEAVYKSVGARFLPLLTKQMDIFRMKIFANMPKIQATLEKLIKFIFKAFEAVVLLGTRMWSILGRVWDFFKALDSATDGWSTKIGLLIAAWKFLNLSFLATPLGMIIAGFVALLALWDDFKTFKEGGESLINWGSQTTKIVIGITAAIAALGATILTLMGALRVITAVQWLWNAALTANPIGLIIVAVTTLIGLLGLLAAKMGYLKGLGNFFGNAGEQVMNFLGGSNANPALNNLNQPAPLIPQNPGNQQHIRQENNTTVYGVPDANAVGKAVSSANKQSNFDLTRNLVGATR